MLESYRARIRALREQRYDHTRGTFDIRLIVWWAPNWRITRPLTNRCGRDWNLTSNNTCFSSGMISSGQQRDQLRGQIEDLDLDQLSTLIAGHDAEQDFAALAASASSPPAVRADGSGANWTLEEARERGEQALQAGEVGAVIVAGGQGTRLGFDQPKGMFPIGPVSQRTLFQFFADRLVATGDRYGARIPLYVMTSDATDAETREYFEQNDYLGLSPEDVRIFKQGTMPAVDATHGQVAAVVEGLPCAQPRRSWWYRRSARAKRKSE